MFLLLFWIFLLFELHFDCLFCFCICWSLIASFHFALIGLTFGEMGRGGGKAFVVPLCFDSLLYTFFVKGFTEYVRKVLLPILYEINLFIYFFPPWMGFCQIIYIFNFIVSLFYCEKIFLPKIKFKH